MVARIATARLTREIGIIAVAYFAYFGVRSLTEGSFDAAFANAKDLVAFEKNLGFFVEPTANALIVGNRSLINLANWVYLWGHWPIIIMVSIWLYRKKVERYVLYRNALLVSGGIALLLFVFYPVAPPRFNDLLFVDTVTQYTSQYHVLQPAWLTNQLAAFPSMHFGWNLLVCIALVRESRNPIVRAIGVASPIIMLAAIVFTANHYIIDGAAGGAVALVGMLLAVKITKLSTDTPAEAAAAPGASTGGR